MGAFFNNRPVDEMTKQKTEELKRQLKIGDFSG